MLVTAGLLLLAELVAGAYLLSHRQAIQSAHAWTWVGCGRTWSFGVTVWPFVASVVSLGLAMKADPYDRRLDRDATAMRVAASILLVSSIVLMAFSVGPHCVT